MTQHLLTALFAGHHGGGLALEVDVWIPADVDSDPMDGSSSELPRHGSGIVVGNRFAAVAAHTKSLAGNGELAGLGLDPTLAHLVISVIQGQDAGGDTGRLFAILVKRCERIRFSPVGRS
jgi:hypothetical protein